jgi:hypothetical protein
MNKYNIEGGINFFEELYKSLDIDESEEKTEEDKNNCLITNQPLSDKHVILNCGHKFNYIPLYHDILNHKKKFNHMEGSVSKLHANEIRCPYCRKKQTGLLPYYEEFGLQKVSGVNFYDVNKQTTCSNFKLHKCEYQSLNQNFDPNKPESNINKKYTSCFSNYATKITGYDNEPNIYNDDKHYCYTHKKQVIKEYKLKEKEKIKEEKALEKVLEKEEKQKAKEQEKQKAKEQEKLKAKEEKQKAKEEKHKAKEEKKPMMKTVKSKSENVVLGLSIIESEKTGCVQILKTGPNKGTSCGCKIFADNICKRHMQKN